MANPWMKKNPFMSLWLSAANRVAAQAQRNLRAAVASATPPPLARRKPRPKR